MIAPPPQFGALSLKASLSSLHSAMVEECSIWMTERWVGGESNEAQMSAVSLSPSHRLGQNSEEEPPVGGCGGGSQELNINNPTADAHQAGCTCVTPWSGVCRGSWRPTWSFVPSLWRYAWDTGVRPPTASRQRRWISAPETVPQSSLTAETCLKVHGFPSDHS